MRAKLLAVLAAVFVTIVLGGCASVRTGAPSDEAVDTTLGVAPTDQQADAFILPMDEDPEVHEVWSYSGQQGLFLLNRYDLIVLHPGPGWDIPWCNNRAYFDVRKDYAFLCQILGKESVHHLGLVPIGADLDDIIRWKLRVVGYESAGRTLHFNRQEYRNGSVEYNPYFTWRELGQTLQTEKLAFGFYPITYGPLANEWYVALETGYPRGSAFDTSIWGDFELVRAAIQFPDPMAGR